MVRMVLLVKKALFLVGICIVATIITLAAIGLFGSLRAYGELKNAKGLLFSAKASLEKQDIKSAAASFAKARDHMNKADSELKAHRISVGFLKIIPYAGTQIRAIDHFVQIGAHLSNAGMLLTGAVRGIPGIDAAATQDNASIGTMVDVLSKLGNDLAPVEQELLLAQNESRTFKTGWLIGFASRMKRELDQKLDPTLGGLQKARKLMAVLPSIMGAAGAPPKNYMVLQQDCYELRASGGLISNFGILQCSHDSLKLADYQRSSTLSVGLAGGQGEPPIRLGGYPTVRFWDAGWWPDFHETTDVLSRIWSNNRKAPVDGYIAVDPIAIGYVLERTGPIEMPEVGETVTADNLLKLIAKYAGTSRYVAFLDSLSAHFFQKVTGSSPRQWFPLGRAFAQALAEKHMLLYFNDPGVEQSFSELDWSGGVKQSSGDYLMAVDSNIGGNTDQYKLNMWVKPKMSVEVTRQKDSTLLHHVTYTFDNRSGAQEFPLPYWSYLRLYVPGSAVAVADPGLVDSGSSDLGKHVLAKSVEVPTGKVVTVEFKYVTPGYGSMLVQKQPGQVNLDIALTILEGGSIKKKQEVKLSREAKLDLSK